MLSIDYIFGGNFFCSNYINFTSLSVNNPVCTQRTSILYVIVAFTSESCNNFVIQSTVFYMEL